MKLTSPKLWISLLSAAGVAYLVLGDLGREAPGPLATVHARHPELTGFGSCSNCHGGWTSTMVESCLECHTDIAGQLEAHTGVHGTLNAEIAQRCSTCHSDHNGADFLMVNGRSFAIAGLGGIQQFDHARIGFPMSGKHLSLPCSKCHENAELPVLPEGGRRYLGLAKDCSTCHEDAHGGKMVVGCASCHGQQSFDQLDSMDHDRYLSLGGGHARLTCRECHAAKTPHSLDAVGTNRNRQPRQCASCHESPHAAGFLAAVGKRLGRPAGNSCSACHTAGHLSFRDRSLTVTAELHALSGFSLQAPHDEAKCKDCHGTPGGDFRRRHPGRSADDCRKCHKDPHGGQFDTGRFATRGCVGCHERTHFEPTAFTPDRHGETGFPLTGRHVETDCTRCHGRPGEGMPRTFAGTTRECAACHGDAHGGCFRPFDDVLHKGENGACATCHDTESFRTDRQRFDHGRFTGLPIAGAHAQIECEECHVRAERPDRFGRTFGRLQDLHPGIGKGGDSCATCHTDPHRGGFDRRGMPRQYEGRTGCERCHTHNSFRSVAKSFDHRLWTGFPLLGTHGKVACSDCHEPVPADDRGRTWGLAAGKHCADCHRTDPHAGQFDPPPARPPGGQGANRADCGRCHRTTTFNDLSFNHDIHSRFRLGERHRHVACTKCHQQVEEGGTRFVRYRPVPRECVDCHAKQQDPFGRRRKE